MNISTTQEKFVDPFTTAKGETRASVELRELKTLWFNTGTRCNLSCENCYIESHPKNDRLSFISTNDVIPYLEEILENQWPTKEVGYTGGEPFLNPHMLDILEETLKRGFKTLVLTNAYRLQKQKGGLNELREKYGDLLVIRVSLDHYTKAVHEQERGVGTFDRTMVNVRWLHEQGFSLAIAGRSLSEEPMEKSQAGYEGLLKDWNVELDVSNKGVLVVFPEMSPKEDVPEITTACWDILNKSPEDVMCASSRMVVRRKEDDHAKVLACTLLAYDPQFEMGETLKDSKQSVQLNHRFCSQFCVLGGASCS